jgi:hypothetical protein
MNTRPLRRPVAVSPGLALGLLALLLSVVPATPAAARTEALRWTQASPAGVRGFRIYWGTQSRNYTQSVDTGPVTPDSSGIYHFSITVPDNAVVYIAVTSYNAAGQESTYSNERQRSPTSTAGGTPPPSSTPPPTTSPPPGTGSGSGSSGQPLGAPGQPTLVQ